MTIPTASTQKLTPLLFLERSAAVYPHRAACIYNGAVTSYALFYERVRRQAAALRKLGVEPGDRVAFLLPNLPSMLEANFGPMGIGAVLVALNIRLSPREIAYILNHSKAQRCSCSTPSSPPTVRQVRDDCPRRLDSTCRSVDDRPTWRRRHPRPRVRGVPGQSATGRPELTATPSPPRWTSLTVNYTSGTTGMPKGRAVHTRAARTSTPSAKSSRPG